MELLGFFFWVGEELGGDFLDRAGKEYLGNLQYLHASETILVKMPVAFAHLLDESIERYLVALLVQFTRSL